MSNTKNNFDFDDLNRISKQKQADHEKIVEKALEHPKVMDESRATSLVSMTKSEKARLTEISRAHGLSLSAFFRLAANEYISNHGW